jgi:hypothetical protein
MPNRYFFKVMVVSTILIAIGAKNQARACQLRTLHRMV